MRILVTGGAGFIGSSYVRQLLGGEFPGYENAGITVLDKLTYAGNTGNLPMADARLSFAHADICDRDALSRILPGHDAVVHLAGESHVERSITGAQQFSATNVLGTQALLDACVETGVKKVVHVSTAEVYGSIAEGSWHEESLPEPNSPYAASKAASDLVARAYWRTHGLDVSVTRCANNYGPRQFVEKLIPRFVTNLLDGREVPLYGDGGNSREWLHVTDHCRAIQLVLERGKPGEVYNVTGREELTNRDLTWKLLELCDAGPERVRHVPDRLVNDLRYSLDDSKIHRELGFSPRVPFDSGLADVVTWYRENRAWWEPLRPATASV